MDLRRDGNGMRTTMDAASKLFQTEETAGANVAVHTALSPGGLYFHRMTYLKAGAWTPPHVHTYMHDSQVLAGRAEVWTGDDGLLVAGPGDIVSIPAGVPHWIRALEPNTVVQCVHIGRDDKGTHIPFSYERSFKDVIQVTSLLTEDGRDALMAAGV